MYEVLFHYLQVNKDFTAVAQMDPSYFAVNHYVTPTNYYASSETYTEPGHIPAYVETYSGQKNATKDATHEGFEEEETKTKILI